MMTSEICSGSTLVRARSALMIWAPSSTAGTLPIVPLNFPTPERRAAAMTISFMEEPPLVQNQRPSARTKVRAALFLPHVLAGCIVDRRVLRGAERGRRHALGRGMRRQPSLPHRPPGPALRRRLREPLLRRERLGIIRPGAYAVPAPRMGGAAHDSGVVPAGG